MEIGLKEGPLRAAYPQWGPHNKYPHPPVITPENLTNERTDWTIHKAAWPQLKISIPFTWFSFQFQEFQFKFHKFPILPIPVLKLELSHNSNSQTELPPNPEYYGSHLIPRVSN